LIGSSANPHIRFPAAGAAWHALTIRHPYAQAIACGLKKIETRGQRTRYRGRLAIRAALGHALPLAVPI
jgi:hypothetical protein